MQTDPMTLAQLIELYLSDLTQQGKHPRTIYTYGKDCQQILAHFGAERKLCNIIPAHIARFYKSAELMRISKSGKSRAPATIVKTKRVLRQLLSWAHKHHYLSTLPFPKEATHQKPLCTENIIFTNKSLPICPHSSPERMHTH